MYKLMNANAPEQTPAEPEEDDYENPQAFDELD
jgi:hypothetical protein